MGDLVNFPVGGRVRVIRPIPIAISPGPIPWVVKPGAMGLIIDGYDGSGPGVPVRNRAVVKFDGVPGAWDVSRDSIDVL